MTEVSAFMPKTTQEVVGLLSILFFLFLILGSLRSWARRVPNATTRLPVGVDGLLFLPPAWCASAGLFDLTTFGLAMGHLMNVRAAELPYGAALSAVLWAGAAAGMLLAAAGLMLLVRRAWVPKVGAVLMLLGGPVIETAAWMNAAHLAPVTEAADASTWPDYLTFLWVVSIVLLTPLVGVRAKNTYGP